MWLQQQRHLTKNEKIPHNYDTNYIHAMFLVNFAVLVEDVEDMLFTTKRDKWKSSLSKKIAANKL